MSQSELTFRRGAKGGPLPPGAKPPVLSVSQLVRGANRLLELRFPRLCVEGEVSNLRIVGSGHAYFTLKDDFSSLPITMWRSNVERLTFEMRDGQSVRIFGGLGIFVKSGRFQMYAERAEPAGLGAMMQQLEDLKARLQKEGLFAVDRKRALPRWPRRIGVVTSAHGAAVHDILKVARRRCPSWITLADAVVQGPDAPRTIVRALKRLAALPEVDVVIVGRGGGSVEDLWAFNDERLARAIVECPVPVVSAVGHEVDVSVSDLVADVRAATPSHAAELVVPNRGTFVRALEEHRRRLTRSIERQTLDARSRLQAERAALASGAGRLVAPPRARLRTLERRLEQLHPRARVAADRQRLRGLIQRLHEHGGRIANAPRNRLEVSRVQLERVGRGLCGDAQERVQLASRRLERAGRGVGEQGRLRLARAAAALEALSPLRVLSRGYAVVTDANGRALTEASAEHQGARVRVKLSRGALMAEVTAVEPAPPGEPEQA